MDNVKERLIQTLEGFRSSREGQMTVKELLTTTSNVALPTMVDTAAILELQNWVDARAVCKRVQVPKGAGKTATIQVLTAPAHTDWSTEGDAISPADPTVASASVTVASFGKATVISDLLANTSAIDFVQEVGKVHGGVIGKAIMSKVATAGATATTNAVPIGVKGDATEANFTMDNVATASGNILGKGWKPDYILTAPEKAWKAFTTTYAVNQFTGALNDFLLSGKIPNVLGLNWLIDPYFELGVNGGAQWNGTNGEKYAIIGASGVGIGWGEMTPMPQSEIYRLPLNLTNTIVTHIDGAAAKVVDNALAVIKHANA